MAGLWNWIGAGVSVGLTVTAFAGGSAENAIVIIDPTRPDAQYIGNYYRHARNIPDINILYMDAGAANYSLFVDRNLDAFWGKLANSRIADHIDYVIIAPPASFYIAAPAMVDDGCATLSRFAISSAYTTAFIADEILEANLTSSEQNRYYRGGISVQYFDSSLSYKTGQVDNSSGARRYFIGATLGYTGLRGNTVDELINMIDRSVASDGAYPEGTVYYMETTDSARSGPRDSGYDAAVTNVQTYYAGVGDASHLMGVLPVGQHDCMGVMTGAASPGIAAGAFTLMPGAFCDHLTSFAARFDTASQEKISLWIAKGASGSWGAVEEPCNYPGKFPHPRLHVFYVRGLSLGEAALRSAQYVPFQMMLYGDPLTQPFARIPRLSVNGVPTGSASGVVYLTPVVQVGSPANPASYELLIDGVSHGSIASGSFAVDTRNLNDGWHDVRVLGSDGAETHSTGRWIGSMVTNNFGGSMSLTPLTTSGNHATAFGFILSSNTPGTTEVRLVHNGRVVAACSGSTGTVLVHGLALGAGPVTVQGEALTASGKTVRSAPATLNIQYADGLPTAISPTTYSYTKWVRRDSPVLVELPATFDNPATPLTYELLSGPSQASVPAGQTGPYRLIRPSASAHGTDSFTFRVSGALLPSMPATVTLEYYDGCPGDVSGDNVVDLADMSTLLSNFGTVSGATYEEGDLDGDGDVDLLDLSVQLSAYGSECL